MPYVSDIQDGTVRVQEQQVITREIKASERNAHRRTCLDVAMQGLAPRFPGEKELCHCGEDFPSETFRVLKERETRLYGEYRTKRLILEAWTKLREV